MLSIFALGSGLIWCFGTAVGNTRQGWAILAAMMILFLAGAGVADWQEATGNPVLHHLGVPGGNMEGTEVRFGIAASALFATVTTAASCGAVNAMPERVMMPPPRQAPTSDPPAVRLPIASKATSQPCLSPRA